MNFMSLYFLGIRFHFLIIILHSYYLNYNSCLCSNLLFYLHFSTDLLLELYLYYYNYLRINFNNI